MSVSTGKTPQLFTNVSFSDAQKLQRDNPDSFEAPSQKELDQLKVGDVVKVSNGQERFWTIIKELKSSNVIIAEVNNRLMGVQPYNLGDLIQFTKTNIYTIRSARNATLMGETLAYAMELTGKPLLECYSSIDLLSSGPGMSLETVHQIMKQSLERKSETKIKLNNHSMEGQLTPQEVFDVVKTERVYQDKQSGGWNHKGHPSIEAEILLMEEYLSKARTAWSSSSDKQLCLDMMRKVVGVGVRCFEHHGCPPRIEPRTE